MSEATRIEICGPLDLVGVALYGDPRKTEFCRAWDLFGRMADESGLSRIGFDLFGLQVYHPDFPQRFELTYMAGVRWEPGREVPIRMFAKSLPRCRYAVRTVEGGVAGIDEALRHLYEEFIPGGGFRSAMPFDLERYRDVRDHDTVPDDIEIWVPIEDT